VLVAWKPETRAEAVTRDCPRCGLPTLHQRHGLPWTVTADAQRLTPDQAAKLAGPNRLAWCLRESKWTGVRLVMVLTPFHSPVCMWAHVVDHQCPPGTPTVKGALW
jgi:hypothetical protein